MSGLAALAVTLALLGDHNGHWLLRQFDRPEVRRVLPIGFVLELAPRVRIGFHGRPELPKAFFSSDTLWRSEPGGPLTAVRLGPAVNLFGGSYGYGEPLQAPLDLRIDQSQPYFEALIEAYLEIFVLPAGSGYAAVLSHRAAAVFSEVPADQQVDAYRDALAAFGSDILMVAIQIDRSTKKHRARGSDLCRFADSPMPTLYTLWRRNFADSQYPGQYRDAGGSWRNTRQFLAREDKILFVEQVLEGRWNGDPVADFCR